MIMCYNKCFSCETNLPYDSTAYTDGINEYHFCSEECEKVFFEAQTFDNDGVYTIYSSL
jgi:hypothetical protein